MRRVVILTFHFNQNYGAALQAYATQAFLRSNGYLAQFPAYIPRYMRPSSSPFRGIRHQGRIRLKLIWAKLKGLRRAYGFARFRRRHLPINNSSRTLEASQALQASAHAVVVGSDQVWNLNWMPDGAFEGYFFLDGMTGNHAPKRIAYAACFGCYEQPPGHLEAASRLLGEFDAIFVRNLFTARILQENAPCLPELVVDPTLLPQIDWTFGREAPLIAGKYILVYSISEEQKHLAEALIAKVKSRTGQRVVCVGSENRYRIKGCDTELNHIAPDQWVGLIRHADYVITDSFHGCVFAMKFARKLYAYSLSWRAERIVDLLKRAGLEEFYLNGMDAIQEFDIDKTDGIEWEAVSQKLEELSKLSADKFLAALNK